MKRVLLLFLALTLVWPSAVGAQGASPAAVVLSADTKETFSGVTFTAPKDWSMQQTDTITTLTAPENDTRLFIIHIGAATDGKAAVASAWKLVEPSFDRKILAAESVAPMNGWDEHVALGYVTGPEEHRVIAAGAYRKDTSWTVALIDGSASTVEKRGTAAGMLIATLQPEGYSRSRASDSHSTITARSCMKAA